MTLFVFAMVVSGSRWTRSRLEGSKFKVDDVSEGWMKPGSGEERDDKGVNLFTRDPFFVVNSGDLLGETRGFMVLLGSWCFWDIIVLWDHGAFVIMVVLTS